MLHFPVSKSESHKIFFSIKRSTCFKSGLIVLVQSQFSTTKLVQKFEQEIHEHSWRGNNTQAILERLSTFVASLVASQNQPQFQQGPECQHQQCLDNRLQGCSLTRSKWHMRSCFPSCSVRTLSKLERLLGCLTSCRFGINLTYLVPSIKDIEKLFLFEDGSLEADWSQYLAFPRLNSDVQVNPLPGHVT